MGMDTGMDTVTGTGTTTGMDMGMTMAWVLGSGTRSIDARLKFFRLKRQGRFGTAASELPLTVRKHGGTEGQARGKNQNYDDVYDTWSGVGCVA